MTLLERHTQLAELAAAERDAAAGQGSVVVITGAAGMGKTSLVQEFADQSAARTLWGLCDDLLTPRPLGPFRDMFAHRGDQPDFATFLDTVLGDLESPPHPTVAIVEDAHWADQATLDAIRFVGRRIARLRAVLVVTYRDDEVPADHPLRLTLGAIAVADTRRIRLRPLSRHAVAKLAGRADVERIYHLTGGNPFFVREVLATPEAPVPTSVQDAVMARVGRLDDAGLACVELASVVPGRSEPWLLAECGVAAGLDSATRGGLLSQLSESVAFANELARHAIEHSLPPVRRRELNRVVLGVLARRDNAEPARLTHHAAQAGDAAAVARYAPVAARRAASLQSHRAAVAHFEQALCYPDQFDRPELADLLEQYARECRLIARHDTAIDAVQRALELTGDARRPRGRRLCLQSEILMLVGRRAEAERAAAAATALLQELSPDGALAGAYAQRARLAMMAGRPPEAVHWGERGLALAAEFGDAAAAAHIEVTLATARWQLDPDDVEYLAGCLARSRAAGAAYPTARAYVNLAHGHTQLMRYGEAAGYIADGLTYCEETDQLLDYGYLLVARAQGQFEQGRWHEADRDARRALDVVGVGHTRLTGLWIRGLIQARRGDPAAVATLRRATRFAEDAGDPEGRLRAWAASAELRYLSGAGVAAPDAGEVLDLIEAAGPWSRGAGDAALWLARAGVLSRPPDQVAGPRALQVAGRWREAAAAFDAAGRPFDAADALRDAPQPGPLLEALEQFDRLGAAAAAARVRERLSEMGVTGVPRGPRGTTRANPAGLTARQAEVLTLLADNLTYQEIATRLHVSLKTVDHHVSAVRTKLDVRTRGDAVAAGRRLGIVPPEDGAVRPAT
jgi:DNA-binding CsgD family transcriptional regulator/tetratricopeptide (TPR) repeat protein